MPGLCPALKSTGLCDDDACPFRHDLRICELCRVVCTSAAVYNSHVSGKSHLAKLRGNSSTLYCTICAKYVPGGANSWSIHVRGKAHQASATQDGTASNVQPEVVSTGETTAEGSKYCGICNRNILQNYWASHLGGQKHLKAQRFAAFQSILGEATKDKHGIEITPVDALDLGIITNSEAQGGILGRITMKSTVPLARIILISVQLTSKNVRTPFSIDAAGVVSKQVVHGRDTSITVKFQSPYSGHFEDRVEVTFEDIRLRQRFVIVRFVRIIVGDPAAYERLKPTMPYTPRVRSRREPVTEIVPGEAPPMADAVPWVMKLPLFLIPKNIASIVNTGSTQDKVNNIRRMVLPRILDATSHSRHFKNLIWIEEKRSEEDLEIYDETDAQLTKENQYYHLKVPGLAEKRPSVLVGDRILVRRHGTEQGRWFEGHVHFVRRDHVGLRFHTSFPALSPGHRFHVRFKLNRTALRRQHQALDAALRGAHLFFPEAHHIIDEVVSNRPMNPFNVLVASNVAQMQAVKSIVDMKPISVPFVVFGPPGTGKTITIVEAIRQILAHNPNARILACAPSNSAADLIASRLKMYSPQDMLRYYAPSRSRNDVPDELLPFTYEKRLELDRSKWFMRNQYFSVPPMVQLRRYKIIVSTCVSASFAYNTGLPRGHFTHIFVDEAGQATEPEVMISVKTMADDQTKIILSGDPKQLGPIIRCPIARELDLDVSYLERLMNRTIYSEDSMNRGITFVKLVKNFRSHASILKFPNEQFYRGDLEVSARPQVINAYLKWSELPKKGYPVLFHAIKGKDDRENSSPSFFNVSEALQVKDYVSKLKNDRSVRTSDNDIGVITPYHAQCLKIRAALRNLADEVKVGSTEEFQGQERRVIIISTVRSSKDYVNYDLKHTLGFVANPRRFNVAVTRAQALLIIVGDPSVLSLDPLWRSFLNYIYLTGGWRGEEPIWDPRAEVRSEGGYDRELRELALTNMNEFAERLESYARDRAAGEGADSDDDGDENVDRPWREVE